MPIVISKHFADRECCYLGRNGEGICVGVDIMEMSHGTVMLSPINSKDLTARCHIEVPKEDLVALGKVLIKLGLNSTR